MTKEQREQQVKAQRMRDLLTEAVAQQSQFDDVDGGYLRDWFLDWRERVRKELKS